MQNLKRVYFFQVYKKPNLPDGVRYNNNNQRGLVRLGPGPNKALVIIQKLIPFLY